MVKGIEKFEEYFNNYSDNYVLIGGAACDIQIEKEELNPRATKDLDIILIVEALTEEFAKKFWKFIKDGKYNNNEKSSGEKKYYRFSGPEEEDFPDQIELFSRNPDLELEGDIKLTPIPVSEDISSLSAILMDEDYYKYTIDNSEIIDGIHLADRTTLICLKAKAYLDLKERKEKGEDIDSRDIKKHRSDVVRLGSILTTEDVDNLPEAIKDDLRDFIDDIKGDPPNGNAIGKNLGTGSININDTLQQIEKTFHLVNELKQ